MTFSEAVANANVTQITGENIKVLSVTYDSRRCIPGSCFVAMRGDSIDGNRFVGAAIQNGTVAIVTDSQETYLRLRKEYPAIAAALCEHGRHALARIAANVLGHPENHLAVTGVTGTNGKTTTTWIVESILSSMGRSSLLVGTIAYRIAGREVSSPHTTPESSDLLELFAQGVHAGATEAVMEVSSHALEQGRVWGIRFDVAVFTNLTRDHLDFHGSMESYWSAKKRLFFAGGTGVGAPRVSVVCAEDAAGRELARELRDRGQHVETYGFQNADWRASELRSTASGTAFQLQSPHAAVEVRTALVGAVNVLNAIAAIAACVGRGASLEQAAAGCATLAFVPGRFQRVASSAPFTVVVDYAHTDDALRNLTKLGRELVRTTGGRVITLFGCGGDRDRTKRPLMARAAAEGSSHAILTSDNPRTEEPLKILHDAEAGLRGSTTPYELIEDRREAIGRAVSAARDGDIVLLAGKGHEKTQTLRDRVIEFDDAEVARAALRAGGYEA